MPANKMLTMMLLLPALVVLSAATSGGGGQDVTVGEDQNGREITLKVGETLQVELPGLGGTGYSWYLDHPDSRYLELVSEKTRNASPPGMVGGPILHVWRFKATAPGQTQIKLAYYRQWEGPKTAIKHFLLNLNISRNGS